MVFIMLVIIRDRCQLLRFTERNVFRCNFHRVHWSRAFAHVHVHHRVIAACVYFLLNIIEMVARNLQLIQTLTGHLNY